MPPTLMTGIVTAGANSMDEGMLNTESPVGRGASGLPGTSPGHNGAGPGHDGFGRAMARTHHQVHVVEIELLDSKGEERQVVAVQPVHEGQVLDNRRTDAVAGDGRRDASWHMDQRQQVGVGQQLTENLEHLLAAPHAGEPVVNERRFHDRPTSR